MRRNLLTTVVAVLILAVWTPGAFAQTAFVDATLFDGTGADPVENAVVIVMGDRILEVGAGNEIKIPEYLKVVDVSGKWIVTGLIDAHIHYFQSGGLYTRPDVIDLRGWRSYETEMARIEADLEETFQRYLASGVTSVVDVGGGYWNFEVREKANERLYAPRTAVAGPLVSTVSRPQMDIGDPPIIEVDSPEMARELVRKQLEYKPDLIKIWFIVPRDGNFTPNLPIIEATIDEAHAAGVRVAVHATQLEAARASVKAGADVLVHSVDDEAVDEEFVALVKESGAIYTSTLIVMEGYGDVLGGNVRMMDVERDLGDPDVVMDGYLTLPDDPVVPRKTQSEPGVVGQVLEGHGAGLARPDEQHVAVGQQFAPFPIPARLVPGPYHASGHVDQVGSAQGTTAVQVIARSGSLLIVVDDSRFVGIGFLAGEAHVGQRTQPSVGGDQIQHDLQGHGKAGDSVAAGAPWPDGLSRSQPLAQATIRTAASRPIIDRTQVPRTIAGAKSRPL